MKSSYRKTETSKCRGMAIYLCFWLNEYQISVECFCEQITQVSASLEGPGLFLQDEQWERRDKEVRSAGFWGAGLSIFLLNEIK